MNTSLTLENNPLVKLKKFGQSIWLDYIRRNILDSGELKRMIEQDGISGVTSNPAIFEKAIAESHDYDTEIQTLVAAEKNAAEIYHALSVHDIQRTADLLKPVYLSTQSKDGYVSLEVSPDLAMDTEKTVAEARVLWKAVDRPNLFIKVPGTKPGLKAIRQLISEGINVNVTLLFGLPRYREVAEAYIAGLQDRLAKGLPIAGIASVASFFLSRVDVLLDPQLEKMAQQGGAKAEVARGLVGKIAIASAKAAYDIYHQVFTNNQAFQALAQKNAQVQRLLWASTGTKNPNYSDVKYVEALIGPDTVDTVPPETLDAYRDHGQPASRLTDDIPGAHAALKQLAELGIDIDQVTEQLEKEGVEKFKQPFAKLMLVLAEKQQKPPGTFDTQWQFGQYQKAIAARVEALQKADFGQQLWRKNADLWHTQQDRAVIPNALGWLDVVDKIKPHLSELNAFAEEIKSAGFQHIVFMGMGGSSLAPLVIDKVLPKTQGGLPMTVLDTTDPATIGKIATQSPLEKTLFIVASKSGTTAEPSAFEAYFYQQVQSRKGERAGENFVAITDPGTALARLAQEKKFRKTFLNYADIGGRYSALSFFGMVPAALIGVDVVELLNRALQMVHACRPEAPAQQNPGLLLGSALGELGKARRDKITFLTPKPLESLGLWLEQLLAESTGKENKGVLPIAGEPIGQPENYGDDRVFVYFQLKQEADAALDQKVAELAKAGHPVITLQLKDRYDLAQEFFRWEIATAVVGAILEINAFNQPNVQESKDITNSLLALVKQNQPLPEEKPVFEDSQLRVYADQPAQSLAEALRHFLGQIKAGDYFAEMAYLSESAEIDKHLTAIRAAICHKLHVATTSGYGPRFLHSTGQFHKGGPNTGVFLQFTAHEKMSVPIPNENYSFGLLIKAQAQGDFQTLKKHQRRVMRIDLGVDSEKALAQVAKAVVEVLQKM